MAGTLHTICLWIFITVLWVIQNHCTTQRLPFTPWTMCGHPWNHPLYSVLAIYNVSGFVKQENSWNLSDKQYFSETNPILLLFYKIRNLFFLEKSLALGNNIIVTRMTNIFNFPKLNVIPLIKIVYVCYDKKT